MNLLIVAATPFEVQPLRDYLGGQFAQVRDSRFVREELSVDMLITGAGMVQTAYALGRVLALSRYHLAINAGIAGAFDRSLRLGDVVQVVSERLADLGVEERNGRFTDVFEMGLIDPDQPPFLNGVIKAGHASDFDFLPKCNGLTVNRVHGAEASIRAITEKYDAGVETMEGAAFFYACSLSDVPFLQIRAISNYVEPRNRSAWNLPLAINNLNEVLIKIVQSLGIMN
ncbi:MAG TPA: futalosine hydrolase [Bacteroidetes bacterium]|nr:futalosine hydrolase [Bacteroidota bacterium]